MHSGDFETMVAREMLVNEFQRYVSRTGIVSNPLVIDLRGFKAVLGSFALPGISPLRSESVSLLYEAITDQHDELLVQDFIDIVFPQKEVKRVVINNKVPHNTTCPV